MSKTADFKNSNFFIPIVIEGERMFTRTKKKGKFITRRELPSLLMKQAETKFKGVSDDDKDFNSGSFIDEDFSIMATGTDTSARIGNEIQVTGLWGRVSFSNSTDGSNPTNRAYFARVLVYTSRDNQAANPDVFPTELLDKESYVVWFDKVVPIPWQNSISNSLVTVRLKFKPYIKLRYDNSSNTSCLQNRLRLAISTDCISPALVKCSYGIRMYFRDI